MEVHVLFSSHLVSMQWHTQTHILSSHRSLHPLEHSQGPEITLPATRTIPHKHYMFGTFPYPIRSVSFPVPCAIRSVQLRSLHIY